MKASAGDARLLSTLIRAEKQVHESFKEYSAASSSASSALSNWAVADTGDAPDVMAVSQRIAHVLGASDDAGKAYAQAMGAYRAALKDVASREGEIRVILRDRDILISRLVKLNNKRDGDKQHTAKLLEAKAELSACEDQLKIEERALQGVKRRIFREALRMRMNAMGQFGDALQQAAHKSVALLDSLDPELPHNPHSDDEFDSAEEDLPPPRGTFSHDGSIAPSHSASQVLRKQSGYESSDSDSLVPVQHTKQNGAPPRKKRDRAVSAPPVNLHAIPVSRSINTSHQNLALPSASAVRQRAYAHDSDASSSDVDLPGATVAHKGYQPSSHTRQASDPVVSKKSSGIFSFLFRKRENSVSSAAVRDDDSMRGFRMSSSKGDSWSSRTDKNLRATSKGWSRPALPGRHDSSDDDIDRSKLVKVVNNGNRTRAASQSSKPPKIKPAPVEELPDLPAPRPRTKKKTTSRPTSIAPSTNSLVLPSASQTTLTPQLTLPSSYHPTIPQPLILPPPTLSRSGTQRTTSTTGTRKKKRRALQPSPIPEDDKATESRTHLDESLPSAAKASLNPTLTVPSAPTLKSAMRSPSPSPARDSISSISPPPSVLSNGKGKGRAVEDGLTKRKSVRLAPSPERHSEPDTVKPSKKWKSRTYEPDSSDEDVAEDNSASYALARQAMKNADRAYKEAEALFVNGKKSVVIKI